MPGNEVGDRIQYLYELENSSQCKVQSQAVDAEWPEHIYNNWTGEKLFHGKPLGSNALGSNVHQIDSFGGCGSKSLNAALDQKNTQLNSGNEVCSDTSIKRQQLTSNGFMFGGQSFWPRQNQPGSWDETSGYDPHSLALKSSSFLKSHQEYASGDSPTLTTNSERSEVTESSTDLNFLGGSQHLVSAQQKQQQGASQFQSMQQPGFSDMHLLQQQTMFKQLQELQRQQQFQQFGDARRQSSFNQMSSLTKQDMGFIRTPFNDSSPMRMNWVQQDASPTAEGVSNRLMFSQEQCQAFYSAGQVPQQLDASLYGVPVSDRRGNFGQYSQLQGMDNDPSNLLTKASGNTKKSTMQPTAFGNPFIGDQGMVSTNLVASSQGTGASISKQGFHGRNMLNQGAQSLDSGRSSGDIQQGNAPPKNALLQKFQERPAGAGWPGNLQKKMIQHGPSQELVPLDPIEEKILYNIDDRFWDASFDRHNDVGTGGFGNSMEHSDYSDAFPSVQSGSWSALMQSAVAEASSTDTGIQEEWSGLTFQNTDLSSVNQPTNIVDSEKQRLGWVDNNLQSPSSFNSMSFSMCNDSIVSSSFPGFQQPAIQLPINQREHLHQEDSHESFQKSLINNTEWLDCSSQQTPYGDGSQQVKALKQFDNTRNAQMYEHPDNDSHSYEERTASYKSISQPHNKAQGVVDEAGFSMRGSDGFPWKTDGDSSQLSYRNHIGLTMNNEESESKRNDYNQISNGPIGLKNSYERANETFNEKQHQRDDISGHYSLKPLSSRERKYVEQSKFIDDVSCNAMNLDEGCLNDFQRNSKALGNTASGGNLDASANSHRSSDLNITAKISQNMLELVHKVDRSTENSSKPHFPSTSSSPSSLITEAGIANTFVSQQDSQSPSSQGFTLRLAPPSQRLSYSHPILQSQPQSENSRLGEKNQTSIAPPFSNLSLTYSHEPSQNAYWDGKSSSLRDTGGGGGAPHSNSATAFTSSSQCVRNQFQMQVSSETATAGSSSLASLPVTASRYPNFVFSQDTSCLLDRDGRGQQFPILEARPVSEPQAIREMGQHGGMFMMQPNLWRNISTQNPSVVEANKVLPIGGSNNSMETTSSVSKGLNGQTSEEPEIHDTSEAYENTRKNSNADSFASGSLLAPLHQQQLGGMTLVDHHRLTASQRNHDSSDQFLVSTYVDQNHSALHQMKEMKNVETDPRRVLDLQQVTAIQQEKPVRVDPKGSEQNSASPLNSNGNGNIISSLAGVREDPKVKSSLQPAQGINSGELTAAAQLEYESQHSSIDVASSNVENSQINMDTVPSWFKQIPTLRNGQMSLMYNAWLTKPAIGNFSRGNLSMNLHKQTSLTDSANVNQSDRVWSNTVVGLVKKDPFSAPHVLTSNVIGPVSIVRPKKRKSMTSELLPWNEEVNKGSLKVINISVAEQDWARATNRIMEKVEDGTEKVEDGQLMLRSKKRIIRTRQMMQQLLSPAPATIFSAHASSLHDSVPYFVARLSLGDACSLIYCSRKDVHVSFSNSSTNSENLKAVGNTDKRLFANVVENFAGRAVKLENDLLRLEKAASILDLSVECQELERISVINRFAKFHIRQAEGLAMTAIRICPQRYVTINPTPSDLPDGVECLSL